MRKLLLAALFSITPLAPAQSTPPGPTVARDATAPAAELSVGDAIILGTVEGITEYLPVSSTGHLIIATDALGLTSEQQLKGRDGQLLWHEKPSAKHPAGRPLTQKLAADTFTIVIQFGAIAAVALLYWRQLLSMINGVLGRDPAGLKLTINLLVAFLPAAVIGLAVHSWIEENLFSIGAVIAAQVVGAVMMLWAERRRRLHAATTPVVTDLTVKQSFGIGLLQCLALWPGTSRSMVTIVGGYLAGLDPRRSAEFSFLLGFITLTAATVFKSYKSGGAMIQVFGWSHVILGCAVATVTAALAVRFLVRWLTRHGLAAFAWYRVAFAVLLALLTYC